MGQRLTLNAWNIFKENFPECIEDIITVDFPVSRYNIFIKRRRRRKNMPSKTNKERYGKELGTLIEWLDENINEQYHVEFEEKEERYIKNRTIRFYFMEETDAMAFKLMFEK